MLTEEQKERAAEFRERREAESNARANDCRLALAVCREIRDNPEAADADRLQAIRIIYRITRT